MRCANALETADTIRSEQETVPWMVSVFCRSQAKLGLYRLKDAIDQGRQAHVPKLRRRALKSCRALLRQTRKVAQYRAEAYRLKGTYFWLIDKPGPAFKWMTKAVQEGERLGARLELSRTYFDIGKQLMASDDRYHHLNGITADEYLGKAKIMFQEMNLQSDLDQLNRLAIL